MLWMRRAAFVIVALMLLQPAAATWRAYGTHEPDTGQDRPEFLPFDPPPADVRNRVYFNAWAVLTLSASIVNAGSINPNVGLVGTSLEVPTSESYFAILGVWIDCNSDGYVGMAETSLREYDAKLLLDGSVCPPRTGIANRWDGSPNYNGWVSEFIPIGHSGGDTGDDHADLRIYRDASARIWGDNGRIDSSGPGVYCVAFPRGSLRSTGALVTALDCQYATIDNWNELIGTADPSNGLGLRYTDPDRADQAGHPMQQETFGTDDSERSAVSLRDCGADPVAQQRFGDFTTVHVFAPAPSLHAEEPTAWTIPATYNMTLEELPVSAGATANCNYDDAGDEFYLTVEDDLPSSRLVGKRAAAVNFAFSDGSRGGGGGAGGSPVFAAVHGGTGGMDERAGVGLTSTEWGGGSAVTKQPATVRMSLSSPGPADAPYFTYYATVGEGTTGRGLALPGGSGIYGSYQCGSETSGILRGWDCDRGAWYPRNANSGDLAKPGDVYQLRDVDCHDGSNDFGILLGPAAFGDAPCTPP